MIINFILLLIVLLILLSHSGSYFHGYLVGKSHYTHLKETFTYINMNDYSTQLDNKEFINGYMNGLKK